MQLIRFLLTQTNLETKDLILLWCEKQGFDKKKFHTCVDGKGPSVVFCKTVSGDVFGGYNPCGWINLEEARGSFAASPKHSQRW